MNVIDTRIVLGTFCNDNSLIIEMCLHCYVIAKSDPSKPNWNALDVNRKHISTKANCSFQQGLAADRLVDTSIHLVW